MPPHVVLLRNQSTVAIPSPAPSGAGVAIDRKGTIVSTYVDGRGVAKATRQAKTQVKPTGVFGAFRLPDYHGSDDVRVANEDLARRAKQEMRTWRQDSRRKATAARYRRQRKAAQRAAA